MLVGTIELGIKTDITDPSFTWADWKKLSVPTEEGKYNCYIEKNAAGRISSIEIAKDDVDVDELNWLDSFRMGFISVRSGLCGFFNDKPDYNRAEWEEFCENLFISDENCNDSKNEVYLNPTRNGDAFYTSSNEGSYLVRGFKRNGKYYLLKLVFES